MRIAVLGWGSLCWDVGQLDVELPWRGDGPWLPVEFARVSARRSGALTLVLFPGVQPSRSLWAHYRTGVLEPAIENLATREECAENDVGFVKGSTVRSKSDAIAAVVREWVHATGLDAAIWTDLAC